jgi:hypothetical protein
MQHQTMLPPRSSKALMVQLPIMAKSRVAAGRGAVNRSVKAYASRLSSHIEVLIGMAVNGQIVENK